MLKFQNNNTTFIVNFEDFIFAVFVFLDELYQEHVPDSILKRRNGFTAKLTVSEIISISICGELASIDSENAWLVFCWTKSSKTRPIDLCMTSMAT